MKHKIINLPEIKLVGISARTNNIAEFNPITAKIANIMQKFSTIQTKISNRNNPGKIFATYTNYESDFTGNYTYFIGEEVTLFEEISSGFECMTIPCQYYTKFTSEAGLIPDIVINTWQKIWQMESTSLGGERAYVSDFEVYDERSIDLKNSIVDIYISIKR